VRGTEFIFVVPAVAAECNRKLSKRKPGHYFLAPAEYVPPQKRTRRDAFTVHIKTSETRRARTLRSRLCDTLFSAARLRRFVLWELRSTPSVDEIGETWNWIDRTGCGAGIPRPRPRPGKSAEPSSCYSSRYTCSSLPGWDHERLISVHFPQIGYQRARELQDCFRDKMYHSGNSWLGEVDGFIIYFYTDFIIFLICDFIIFLIGVFRFFRLTLL